MAVEKGSAFQESQLPRLKGLQGESTGSVNLFRGSVNLPVPIIDLPGRNGLQFKCAAFYQSDQADSQIETWSLERPTSILGAGWSMPYERIIVETKQNGTLEDNDYYYVMNGQPAPLKPITRSWDKGVLDSSYKSDLAEGPINTHLREGLLSQQVLVGTGATLTQAFTELNAPPSPIWYVSDPDSETVYKIVVQEDDSLQVCSGGLSFELVDYQYWQISYYPEYERWQIIRNDGNHYSYGGTVGEIDSGTPAHAKQYGIKWGNWMGPSDQATGQEQYVTAWNLAKVENLLGNYYHLNYEVVEQAVGAGSLKYTKECHPRKVKNDLGWSIEYLYEDKIYDNSSLESPKEYVDQHRDMGTPPSTTPNAYQDRYETQYLSEIIVRNDQDVVENYTRFEYYDLWNAQEAPVDWSGKSAVEKFAYGSTYERYLKSITQYTGEGYTKPLAMQDRYSKPGVLFDYYFTTDPSEPRGRLKTMVHPGGGKTTYTYEQVTVGTAGDGARNLTIDNPFDPGKSGDVKTWSGADYTVCCWYDEASGTVLMNVYTWVGHWVRSYADWQLIEGSIDFDQISVVAAQNTFALIVPATPAIPQTRAFLYYRDPLQKALWKSTSGLPSQTYQTANLTVQNGEDFYLFLDQDNGVMDRIAWNPLNKTWDLDTVNLPTNRHYCLTAGDNHYVMMTYNALQNLADFSLTYRKLDLSWRSGTDLKDQTMTIPGFGGFSYCVLQSGESFMAVSHITGYTPDEQGSFESFDYDVKVVSWDTDYVLKMEVIQDIETGTFTNLPSYVLNTPTNIVPLIIENSSVGTGPNFIRYDGVNWTCMTAGLVDKGFTDPLHQYYWYAYGQHALLKTENTDSGIESDLLTVDPSVPTSTGLINLEDSPVSIDRYLKGYPSIRSDYITKGQTVYQQVLTSDWLTIANTTLLELQDLLASGEQIDTTTLINEAPDFMAFLILDGNGEPKDTGYVLYQNGDVVRDENGSPLLKRLVGQQIFRPLDAAHVYKNDVNGRTSTVPGGIIAYNSQNHGLDQTSAITLYRYSARDLVGEIQGFTIKSLETDTGYETVAKCYKYDDPSAAADSFKGEIIRFQTVTEYEGCLDPANQQHGYTVSRFYNGLPEDNTSLNNTYTLLDGQLIHKKVYDNSNTLQSSEEMTWGVETKVATNPEGSSLQNLYGGIPQVSEVKTTHMGVVNTKSMGYNAACGHPAIITTQYYDSQGRLIENWQQIQYGFEIPDYRGLWYLNILTPAVRHEMYVKEATSSSWLLESSRIQTYKLWDINNQEIDHWGPEKTYVALNETPSNFTWWTGPSEPTESDGWQKAGTNITVNEQGHVVESQDALGRPSVSVYDDTETYPLARFGNASFEDGVLYSSFEDYQTNVWSLGSGSVGAITQEDAYIGKRCYQLDPNEFQPSFMTHIITNLANPQQVYCFNLWYKTPISHAVVELEISVSGTANLLKVVLDGTDGEWKPYQWVVDLNELGVTGPVDITLTIKASGYARVDQILFGPRDCRMAAQTFELEKLRALGSVSVNGNSQKSLYNMWNTGFSGIGTYDETIGLGTGYSVRQDPSFDPLTDPFPINAPNRSVGFKGKEKGFYDEFRFEALDNYTAIDGATTDWTVVDNRLELSVVGGTGDLGSVIERTGFSANSLTIYAQVETPTNPSDVNPTQTMSLGIGSFMVQWSGTQWDLMKENGGSYVPIMSEATTNWQPEWMLTVFEDRLFFYANGIEVFRYQDADILSAQPHGVQLAAKDVGVSFKNLVVLEDIQMSFGYHDGSGRHLQSAAVEDSTSIILGASVYDDLGRPAIRPLSSRVSMGDSGVTDIFDYQSGYITNGSATSSLWQGYPMTGSIVDTYHIDADGYPFSRVVYEESPLGRPIRQAQPGQDFAITSGSVNPHITTIEYGVNEKDPNSSEDVTTAFLYPLPAGEYFKTTVKNANGDTSIHYHTQANQPVGMIKKPGIDSIGNEIKSSVVHDLKGRVTASIPPNYYEFPSIIVDGYVPGSSTYTYDFFGRPIEAYYPDSGTSKVVYDKVGRIRFAQDEKGSKATPQYFYYTKYDALGRTIEYGSHEGDWAVEATKTNADDATWPTANNTLIQDVQYDGEAADPTTGVLDTPNMVGRTWQTTHYNEFGTPDAANITHTAAYTPAGQMESQTREMIFGMQPPSTESRSYTYGIDGRLLSETDSVSNLHTDYSYNMLDQLRETQVIDPSAPAPNSVKVGYDYTQLGQLNTVIPYKKDGSPLTIKNYDYRPNGWLKNTTDGFVDQTLQYLENNCEGPDKGYYNGALSHNTTTYTAPGIAPPTSDYCYTADYLRRVVKANNSGGSQYDWTFDENSNLLKYTTGTDDHNYEIETNKNRLKRILSSTTSFERNYVYDDDGNTLTIDDGTNPLLNVVYNESNGKARSIENVTVSQKAVFDYSPTQSRVRKQVIDTTNSSVLSTSTSPIPGVEVIDNQVTPETKAFMKTQGIGLVYHKEAQKFHWVFPDHLGSTRMITDEDGVPNWVFDYDVYGVPTETPYNNPTMTFNNLFTGQYFDKELGLYNYHARFYDPSIGRFLQVDPAHQGFSPYAYVNGMPNIATDPTGMMLALLASDLAAGILNGVFDILTQAVFNKGQINWYQVGASTLVGLVVFVPGVMFGVEIGVVATELGASVEASNSASAAFAGAIKGAMEGSINGLTTQLLTNKFEDKSLQNNLGNATLGGILGGGLIGAFAGLAHFSPAYAKMAETLGENPERLKVDGVSPRDLNGGPTDPESKAIRTRFGEVKDGFHEALPVSTVKNLRKLGFNSYDISSLQFPTDPEETRLLRVESKSVESDFDVGEARREEPETTVRKRAGSRGRSYTASRDEGELQYDVSHGGKGSTKYHNYLIGNIETELGDQYEVYWRAYNSVSSKNPAESDFSRAFRLFMLPFRLRFGYIYGSTVLRF